MERVCDFCKALRPVVYCKADAAYLCLSCDAKVHSANALSGRHPRALVCEFCGSGLVNIRCPNHCLLLCHSCDHSMHKDLSSHHQKHVISCCYLGCPSAKDLAKLWGFNLDEFGLDSLQDKFISTSCLSGNNVQSRTFFGEASSDRNKLKKNNIIQQILDLEKLQLSDDGCQNSSVIRGKDLSFGNYDASWELENNNIDSKHSHETSSSFDLDQQPDSSQQELNPDPFLLSSFPQLDQLTSNSGNPDSSFWQCKSPTQKFQLWSQNMQDLGICEEVGCIDDLNMPDVDLTFRNFEELFGGGGGSHDLTDDSLVDNKDITRSATAKDHETMGHSRAIRPTSHGKMSFSISRFCTTKSNATADCSDSSLSSPAIAAAVQGMHQTETKDIDHVLMKNKQKKIDRRYNDPHEAGAAVMRKVKRRFVKGEEFNGEGVEVTTQSY
ncbi:putative zinc finger protein At1g68190 [Impatiens glandulifera]|uniref:putative zinc finger protein At1g68190 n=1 Tax=Impatiens glandulifera TaxID=253017 RepID=UPI001FB0732E|nr:putative zinc finger protein At1g68190 [Impatiens glandulifera]